MSKDWCSDVRNRLKKAKCYLKTDYRVHCRDEDSHWADHCRKFALSDHVDEDFKHQCLHDHLSKCDSCEELKTVLQSVEGKINELSSFMYSKRSQNKASYKTDRRFSVF